MQGNSIQWMLTNTMCVVQNLHGLINILTHFGRNGNNMYL